MTETKPLIITAYKCPLCGNIEEDKERALRHANIPIRDNPLPQGFIFKGENLQIPSNWIDVICSTSINENHVVTYTSTEPTLLDYKANCYSLLGNGASILLRFDPTNPEKIVYSLLTPEELEDFTKVYPKFIASLRDKHGIEKLVRTCPIDAFLGA